MGVLKQVIAIMRLCEDMDDFRKKFAKVFNKARSRCSYGKTQSDHYA